MFRKPSLTPFLQRSTRRRKAMAKYTRREFLKTTAGAAAAGTLGAGSAMWSQDALAQAKWAPEKGAKLRVLRWKRFVQGDEDMWMANTRKFTEKTGIEVRVDHEGWEDVRRKRSEEQA